MYNFSEADDSTVGSSESETVSSQETVKSAKQDKPTSGRLSQ